MNVVLLKTKAKTGGGFEKVANRIANAFRARGEIVTELTGENIGPWPSFLRMELYEKHVQKWLQNNPADIVFGMDRNRKQTHFRAGNGVHAAFLESRLRSEGRLKYLTCLLNPMHRKILSIEKETFEYPKLKKLFVNSEMVKNQVLERYNIAPNKIQVIHNGVEWDELKPEILPNKEFTFLFIGNGYLRKGLGQLLKAFAQIKGAKLIVVGKDKNEERYKKMAANLPVQFCGPQKDMRPFYAAADALVIPSFYDPFANVTVEALASGLQVVSSKHNGGHEVLNTQTGHIIEDLLSIDSLVHSLQSAMRQPKTVESAAICRNSVSHLNYTTQMKTLIDACYD